eukprot:591852-Heterocapsa_arctica.AAC.1
MVCTARITVTHGRNNCPSTTINVSKMLNSIREALGQYDRHFYATHGGCRRRVAVGDAILVAHPKLSAHSRYVISSTKQT